MENQDRGPYSGSYFIFSAQSRYLASMDHGGYFCKDNFGGTQVQDYRVSLKLHRCRAEMAPNRTEIAAGLLKLR